MERDIQEEFAHLEQRVEDMDGDVKQIVSKIEHLANRIHMTTLSIVAAMLTTIGLVWIIASAYYGESEKEKTALEEQVSSLANTTSILGERVQQMINIIELRANNLSEQDEKLLQDIKQIEKELHAHNGDSRKHDDG